MPKRRLSFHAGYATKWLMKSPIRWLGMLVVLLVAPFTKAQDFCTHRILSLRAEDSMGRVLGDLRPEDFEVKVQKRPVKILSIKEDDRPRRIAILVDASLSMRTNWNRVITLALGLANDQLPDTKLALFLFNDDVYREVDFSEGRQAVVDRLHQLRSQENLVHGSTSLYEALLHGLRLMGTATSADSLYVISDGGDNASDVTLQKALRMLEPSGVKVFVSLVLDKSGSLRNERAGRKAINKLTERTGGEVIEPFLDGVPKGQKEIEQFAERMNLFQRRMISASLFDLQFAEPLTKAASVQVATTNDGRERLNGPHLVFPNELTGCK
jgi:hypothetical protein